MIAPARARSGRGRALAACAGLAALLLLGGVRADAAPGPARVVVLDPAGRPLAGARLVVSRETFAERAVLAADAEAAARSDEDGVLALGDRTRPADAAWLVAADGLAPVRLPDTAARVTVRLLPGRTTAGTLRLARDRPAAGRAVFAVPEAAGSEIVHRTTTDAAGAYRFEGLHAGRWTILLRERAGRLRPIGTVAAGGRLDADRVMDSTSIRGRVLDADGTRGAAAAGVRLRLVPLPGGGGEPASVRTAGDGTFVLAGLAEGIYEMQIEDGRWAFEPGPPRVEVQRGRARDLPAWFAVRAQAVIGQVLDEQEAPLPGASIRLLPEPGRVLPPGARAEGTDPVRSGDDGRFRLPAVAPGEGYRLVATAPGRSPFVSNPFRVDRGEATTLKPFRLRRGWRIELRVEGLDGERIEGATVQGTSARRPDALGDPRWADTVRRGATDADGGLVLRDLPEDDVLLQVDAPGYRPGTLVVDYPRVSDVRRAELVLDPSVTLEGQLTVPEGGLEGPFVVSVRRRDGGPTLRTTAAADGRFTLRDLADSAYDLDVHRERDGRRQHLVRLEGILPGSVERLEVALPTLAAVAGTVEDLRLGGTPPVAVIETRRHDPEREAIAWTEVARATLVPEGTRAAFRVGGLPPGAYTVRVVQGAVDTGTEAFRLDDADVEGLALRMPAGARIAGAVRAADGAPLLGARVEATRLHGVHPAPRAGVFPEVQRTDERGDFVFERLAPGLWRLEARDDERASAVVEVRLRDGEVLVLDDLVLDAGGRIEGLVTDADGRPLDGVQVEARRYDEDGAPLALRTDAEGRFVARHARPGTWRVRVQAATVAGGPWIEALVDVESDAVATVRFSAAEDGAIGGTVRRRGRAVAGATVELVHLPEVGPLRRYRTSTGADGRFHLEHLEAGLYTLQLQSGAWRSAEEIVLRAGDELDLDLVAHEGRLRGRVVTRDGRGVGGAAVRATPLTGLEEDFLAEGRSDPTGAFVLQGLPPGPYLLQVDATGLPPGRVLGAEADLPGADHAIEVVLGRGGDLDLRVEDRDERGITGALVWLEDADGRAYHRSAYVTGAGGRLRIEGVTPGPVAVRVHARGYGRPGPVAVRIEEGGVHPLVVRLEPAGALRMTVTGSAGDPLLRTRIDVLRAGTGEVVARRLPLRPIRLGGPWGWVPRTGVVTIGDLAPGTYLARIEAGRDYTPAEVGFRVEAGATAEVRVELAPR